VPHPHLVGDLAACSTPPTPAIARWCSPWSWRRADHDPAVDEIGRSCSRPTTWANAAAGLSPLTSPSMLILQRLLTIVQ
jgi:hypothetical protein